MSCGSYREPHETIGKVRFPHSMNNREHDGPWELIHIPEKPKPYPQHPGFPESIVLRCPDCRVGIGPSAPSMFSEVCGGEWLHDAAEGEPQ